MAILLSRPAWIALHAVPARSLRILLMPRSLHTLLTETVCSFGDASQKTNMLMGIRSPLALPIFRQGAAPIACSGTGIVLLSVATSRRHFLQRYTDSWAGKTCCHSMRLISRVSACRKAACRLEQAPKPWSPSVLHSWESSKAITLCARSQARHAKNSKKHAPALSK